MPRPHFLLPLLLLCGTAAAQTLPRQWDGHVVYQGRVGLPGLTQEQVLAQAVRFANRHLFAQEELRAYVLLVDSAAHLVSVRAYYFDELPLRYELVLRAKAGSCGYEMSDLATEYSNQQIAESRRSLAVYERVEARLDDPANYDQQRRPRPHLQAYCTTVAREVAGVLAQLRAEMAQP